MTQLIIKKYKCFNNLKVSGLNKVNLITGFNNIGKTAFLETIYIYKNDEVLSSLLDIVLFRNRLEFVNKKIQKDEIINYLSKFDFEIEDIRFFSDENSFYINDKKVLFNDYYIKQIISKKIGFIDVLGWSNGRLKTIYEIVQLKDKEDLILKWIQIFDNSIENFKFIGGIPKCKVNGEYLDLNEFGSGMKLFVSILISMVAYENGYLLIDEVENGIHFKQLNNLWRIIFDLSKEFNIKVFATTHSKEMIQAFINESQKTKENVSLLEFGNNDVIVYEKEEVYLLDEEVRGW